MKEPRFETCAVQFADQWRKLARTAIDAMHKNDRYLVANIFFQRIEHGAGFFQKGRRLVHALCCHRRVKQRVIQCADGVGRKEQGLLAQVGPFDFQCHRPFQGLWRTKCDVHIAFDLAVKLVICQLQALHGNGLAGLKYAIAVGVGKHHELVGTGRQVQTKVRARRQLVHHINQLMLLKLVGIGRDAKHRHGTYLRHLTDFSVHKIGLTTDHVFQVEHGRVGGLNPFVRGLDGRVLDKRARRQNQKTEDQKKSPHAAHIQPSAAATMCAASTPKYARNAARVSLRPKPSVPSVK